MRNYHKTISLHPLGTMPIVVTSPVLALRKLFLCKLFLEVNMIDSFHCFRKCTHVKATKCHLDDSISVVTVSFFDHDTWQWIQEAGR